jgi:hypothetical protein
MGAMTEEGEAGYSFDDVEVSTPAPDVRSSYSAPGQDEQGAGNAGRRQLDLDSREGRLGLSRP